MFETKLVKYRQITNKLLAKCHAATPQISLIFVISIQTTKRIFSYNTEACTR